MLFKAHKRLDDYNQSQSHESPQELWKSIYKMYFEILDEVTEVKKQLKEHKKDLSVNFEIIEKLKKEIGAETPSENTEKATCCKCNIF